MVALPETFAPADVPEDERSFEPLPIGNYRLQAIEAKIEDTKSGTGQMLVLTHEVLEGPAANRRLWDRLNIRNENADAQRIAQRALADFCLQIGVGQLRDTDELLFKPFTAKVGIRQDKTGQYGPQNTIRYNLGKQGVPPAGKAAPTQPGQPARPTTAQGKPAQGAKPWNQPKPTKQEWDDEIPF